MLTLFQFPAPPTIVNMSPFCMKTEAAIRMMGLPYEIEHIRDFEDAPRRQVPYIVDDGEKVGDSRLIIAHLQDKHGIDLDSGLSAAERATGHAVQTMLEEHVAFAGVYVRWADDDNWAKAKALFFGAIPEPARNQVAEDARAQQLAKLHHQALGRHARDGVYRLAGANVDAAAALLGEKPYMFGDRPTLTDAVVFAFVANLVVPPFESPLRDRTLRHHNLVDHVTRMHERFFPERQAIAA